MSSWVYWPQILPQRWSVTTIPSLARPIFVRALLLSLTHHFFFRGRAPKMITIVVWHFEILCLNTGPIWQFFKWHFFRVLNFWAWSRRHLHYIICYVWKNLQNFFFDFGGVPPWSLLSPGPAPPSASWTGLFSAARVLPCSSLMGIINSHCITRSPKGPLPLLI